MRRLHLLLAVSVLVVGCSDEGPRSGPGTLTATLRSPNGAEGAVSLTLDGESIGAITSLGDSEAHSFREGLSTHVVVLNQTGGDLMFRVAVADTTQPPVVSLHEVAGPDDALRASLDGYALEFSR